jgi:hypothetical protein
VWKARIIVNHCDTRQSCQNVLSASCTVTHRETESVTEQNVIRGYGRVNGSLQSMKKSRGKKETKWSPPSININHFQQSRTKQTR